MPNPTESHKIHSPYAALNNMNRPQSTHSHQNLHSLPHSPSFHNVYHSSQAQDIRPTYATTRFKNFWCGSTLGKIIAVLLILFCFSGFSFGVWWFISMARQKSVHHIAELGKASNNAGRQSGKDGDGGDKEDWQTESSSESKNMAKRKTVDYVNTLLRR